MKYTKQISVRIPQNIFESLEKRVKQNNSSLNIEIVGILGSAINKDDKDSLCAEAIEIIKSLRAII